MNKIMRDPFTYYYPKIDIHGETSMTCVAVINSFINDNIKLKNENIIIIHGKGTGILKNATYEVLKNNKNVIGFHIDPWNEGQTIIKLNIKH